MACRLLGDKPLHETMMTQFIDIYMHHRPELNELIESGTELRKFEFLFIIVIYQFSLSHHTDFTAATNAAH